MEGRYGTIGQLALEFRVDACEVIKGIHLVKAPMAGLTTIQSPASAYIGIVVVESARSLVVVDTGLKYHPDRYIMPFLKGLGRQAAEVSLIINTHEHFDHVDGNVKLQELCSAPVAAHASAAHAIPGGVDRILRDGDRLEVGAFGFEILHTPGHSPAHICLWEPDNKVLLCGDAVQGNGAVDQGTPLIVDLNAYVTSLRRLLELDIAYMVPAHVYRGWSEPIILGQETAHAVIEGSIRQLDIYREQLVKILDSRAPMSRHEIHARLLEDLTWNPEEVKTFFVNYLGVDSRPTVESLLRELPDDYRERVTGEKWPDVGEPHTNEPPEQQSS